jgi:asparagine synthase (glutamine-hydrolysing)
MSAVLGIFNLDGQPVDQRWLKDMWSKLSHRGPDGGAVWSEGTIGLGSQMLWTTPESLLERMPLSKPESSLTIVADARIDNREELIANLGLQNKPAASRTDSHVILAAYEKWGDNCPERLIGDFAFAIWDGRSQSLFCARDHFGIKPFYYFHKHNTCFIFASEIKGLLAAPIVPRRLNETRVADYLANFVEDEEITFYRDIRRLPRSQAVRIDRSGCRFRQYWSLDPQREVRYGSDEEYAEAFREKFFQAVECRLRSAFPVGASLSGGLDSSSVVQVSRAFLRNSGNSPLHTFSAIFDEVPQSDERSFINLVLDGGADLAPQFIHLDRLGALVDVDSTLWHLDQPMYIRNMFLWTSKYKMAQKLGVRVLLDGEDGDTVVSHGDGHLAELAQAGQWEDFAAIANSLLRHFPTYHASNKYWLRTFGYPCLTDMARNGQWLSFARATSQIPRYFDESRWNLILNHGLRPIVPQPVRRAWRALRRRNTNGQVKSNNTLVNSDLAERVGFKERQQHFWSKSGSFNTLREAQCLALNAGIHSCVREEANSAAAAFAIESRHPFYDRRLVEFCLALPPEQKVRRDWPRWIFRNAMKNILPREICWRVGKSNLGYNFHRCLMSLEHQRLEELLIKRPELIQNYVNLPAVHKAFEKGVDNKVWPPTILALWLRQTELAP